MFSFKILRKETVVYTKCDLQCWIVDGVFYANRFQIEELRKKNEFIFTRPHVHGLGNTNTA